MQNIVAVFKIISYDFRFYPKQSINLYYKNQFHSNYKIDEHILKKPYPKKCSPYNPTKKVTLIIHYNKFKTSNLIISNSSSSPLKFLIGQTSYICSNVLLETVTKKIILILVLPPQLFQDGLQCT